MPNLRETCKVCKSNGRHRKMPDGSPCPNKRRSGPRAMSMEKAIEIIRRLADDQFVTFAKIIADEAIERRSRIEAEYRQRIDILDSIALPKLRALPSGGGNGEAKPELQPSSLPSHEVAPTPRALQCPAINPGNVEMKCTQPRDHEGQHFNHKNHVGWQRRA